MSEREKGERERETDRQSERGGEREREQRWLQAAPEIVVLRLIRPALSCKRCTVRAIGSALFERLGLGEVHSTGPFGPVPTPPPVQVLMTAGGALQAFGDPVG